MFVEDQREDVLLQMIPAGTPEGEDSHGWAESTASLWELALGKKESKLMHTSFLLYWLWVCLCGADLLEWLLIIPNSWLPAGAIIGVCPGDHILRPHICTAAQSTRGPGTGMAELEMTSHPVQIPPVNVHDCKPPTCQWSTSFRVIIGPNS